MPRAHLRFDAKEDLQSRYQLHSLLQAKTQVVCVEQARFNCFQLRCTGFSLGFTEWMILRQTTEEAHGTSPNFDCRSAQSFRTSST